MSKLRRVVLDTLKPHDPTIIELAELLSEPDGTESVNVSIYEIDHKVENAKVTIEGDAINFAQAEAIIRELGGTIHSIDEVVAGKDIIDDAQTLLD